MSWPADRPRAAGRNGTAIAELERRLRRVQVIFWVCVAFMPAGCLGPLALIPVMPQGVDSSLPLVFALLLPFVGLGGAILMLGDRSRYRRALAVARVGEEMGMTYTEKPQAAQYAWLRDLQRFRASPRKTAAFNLLEGQAGVGDVSILDYAFTVGSGRYSRTYDQTVVALHDAVPDVPDFQLYPGGWFKWLSRMLGEGQVRLRGQPEFNQNFVLRGDPHDVTTCFTDEVIDVCLQRKEMTVEVSGGTLVVARMDRKADPQDYADLLTWALNLAAALECRG
jgi:hypothetical protein